MSYNKYAKIIGIYLSENVLQKPVPTIGNTTFHKSISNNPDKIEQKNISQTTLSLKKETPFNRNMDETSKKNKMLTRDLMPKNANTTLKPMPNYAVPNTI